MTRYERTGQRDLTFSKWHRLALPHYCTTIDIDHLEYCQKCRAPLAYLEISKEPRGFMDKPTTVLNALAAHSSIPAFCIQYRPTDEPCSCDPPRATDPSCLHGVQLVRFRRVHPDPTESEIYNPKQLAEFIQRVHHGHWWLSHGQLPPGCQDRAA